MIHADGIPMGSHQPYRYAQVAKAKCGLAGPIRVVRVDSIQSYKFHFVDCPKCQEAVRMAEIAEVMDS